MSSILTRLLEKGLPTRDVQIATTGEQQQRPLKFEGAQDGNFYNSDLLVVGGQDNSGFARHFNLDTQGRMVITGQTGNGTGGSVTPVTTQGHLPEGSNLTGTNPFLMAGRYNATPRSLNDGEVGAFAINNEGKLMIDLQNASLTATVNVDIDQATDSIQLYGNDGTANRAVKTDATGHLLVTGVDNAGAPTTANPLLMAGSNAGNTVSLAVDTSGNQIMVGAAGHGAAATGNPVLLGGTNAGNVYRIQTDSTGRLTVAGAAADGTAFLDSGNPVMMGARGSDNNLHYIMSDASGRQITVGHVADGNPPNGYPVFVSGWDGTNTHALSTDGSGRQVVVGAAAAGAVPAGNPVLVGGSDGTNATRTLLMAPDGSAVVGGVYAEGTLQGAVTVYPVLAGGVDINGNTTQLHMSQNGNLFIEGPSDEGEFSWPRPVLIGGSDGTYMTKLRTDTTGRQVMVGAAATGTAVAGNPVLNAGSDGTNARTLATDTAGRQVMVGAAATGGAVVGNPVLNAGSDGNFARTLATDSVGRQIAVGAAAEGSAPQSNPVLISGRYDSSARTLTNGTNGALALESDAKLKVALYGTDGSSDRKVKLDTQGVLISRNLPDYTFYMHGEASGVGAQLVLTPNSGVYTPQTFRSQGGAQFPNYFQIVSTDNGNMYGIGGMQQITIEGYRTSGGLFISETINLNGTTPVSTANAYNVVLRVLSTNGNLVPGSYITVRPDDYNTTMSYLEITETDVYNPIFYNVNAASFCTHISISTDAASTFSIWTVNNENESRSVVWRRRFAVTRDFEMDFGPTGAFKVQNNEYIIVMNEGLTNANTTFSLRFDSYKA